MTKTEDKKDRETGMALIVILVLALALALSLVGCTTDDTLTGPTEEPAQAIAFGAYLNRSTTRAGVNEVSPATLPYQGFGVFAYYTDDSQFEANGYAQPNFMYNQQVTSDDGGSTWVYSPVKYWPNETGASATSAGTDRLSFFAYAPYVSVTPSTGKVTDDDSYGITRLTPSSATGDPRVRYYVSFDPAQTVDLCRATPVENLTKQAISEKVSFNFSHALAALNVQVDALVDATSASAAPDQYTRIWVRSVTFEGFTTRGELNLVDGKWYDLDGCACESNISSVTVNDGRRDGREGMTTALNEQNVGLNPVIVQSAPYAVYPWDADTYSTTPGVANTPVNLFKSGTATKPIYVIPTGDAIRINIVYDVETYDPKLKSCLLADGRTCGSTVENNLFVNLSTTLAAGKSYTINLHLGMTSVKADVSTVDSWPAVADATASGELKIEN